MAASYAAAFYTIQPPRPGDDTIQVSDRAWSAVLEVALLPAHSMSSEAAASLMQAFQRVLLGGLAQLPREVVAQFVLVQQPLDLGPTVRRYQDAARDLAERASGASDVAWAWARYAQGLGTSGVAVRRGAVVLTAQPPAPSAGQRARGLFGRRRRGHEVWGQAEALAVLEPAVRQVRDALADAGFGAWRLIGDDLAEFVSLWTRGERLSAAHHDEMGGVADVS